MKLATTTGDLHAYTLSQQEAVKNICKAGFKYLDYNFHGDYTKNSGIFGSDPKAHIEDVKRLADSLGVKFVQAHSPMGKPLLEEGQAEFVEATRQCIEACAVLGVPNLVVHSGYVLGYSLDRTFEANKEFYMKLLPTAEKYGINILVENSATLKKMLEKGSIDFIVDNAQKEKENEYKYQAIANEHILLAIPKSFPINEKLTSFRISNDVIRTNKNWYKNHPKVNMRNFKDDKFILLRYGNNMRQISNKIFKENNIIPNVIQEFDHLMTSISYAEAGFGICFITDSVLKYAKNLNDISLYLPDTSHSERTLYVIRKKNKYLSFSAQELIKHIVQFQTKIIETN